MSYGHSSHKYCDACYCNKLDEAIAERDALARRVEELEGALRKVQDMLRPTYGSPLDIAIRAALAPRDEAPVCARCKQRGHATVDCAFPRDEARLDGHCAFCGQPCYDGKGCRNEDCGGGP